MADGNKEWVVLGSDARFSFEIDHCLPFQLIPDRAEMQRRYMLGQFRKLIIPSVLARMRFLNARANSRQRTD